MREEKPRGSIGSGSVAGSRGVGDRTGGRRRRSSSPRVLEVFLGAREGEDALRRLGGEGRALGPGVPRDAEEQAQAQSFFHGVVRAARAGALHRDAVRVDAVEEREERVHLGGVVVPARAFGGGGDLVPEARRGL